MDEEALRDEHNRLRAMVDGLQREASEIREKLRAAERDSGRKDKLLQEVLAAATVARGVPGEALDQIREDVQAMVNIKRGMHDASKVIEEKDHKVRDMRDVLKTTPLSDMEDKVDAAKKRAKAKANDFAGMEDDGSDSHSSGRSRELQSVAKSLLQRAEQIDGEMLQSLRRVAKLKGEQEKYRQAMDDHAEQAEKLRGKSSEISKQAEHCRSVTDGLGDVEARHRELKEECHRLTEEPMVGQASIGRPRGHISAEVFEPGFRPLGADCRGQAWRTLSCLRQSIGLGWQSGLDALLAEDTDRNGRVSAAEFSRGLETLRIKGASSSASQDLVNALDDALYSRLRDLLNVADLIFCLPLQTPPCEPSEQELQGIAQSLVWACRRQGQPERELRSRLAGWLDDSRADLEAEASKLCRELGLQGRPETAGALARGLEARREGFAALLPSWRHHSVPSQAFVLVNFIHDLAFHRDSVTPLFSAGPLPLESFIDVGMQHLGSHWSLDDLEQVALLAECPGAYPGDPPAVDGPRLLRAASPEGLAVEFPELQGRCQQDALRKCEAAVKVAIRRASPAGQQSVPGAGVAACPATEAVASSPAAAASSPAAAAAPVAAAAAPGAAAASPAAPGPASAAATPGGASPGGDRRTASPTEEGDENYEEEYEEDMEEDFEEPDESEEEEEDDEDD